MTSIDKSPEVKDWLSANADLFQQLREGRWKRGMTYTIFVDFDMIDRAIQVGAWQAFVELEHLVGDLGIAKLELVFSGMDGSDTITLAAK